MDGLKAAQLIREMGFHSVPIIALTANALVQDQERSKQHMNAYLTKPFVKKDLLATIKRVTGSSSSASGGSAGSAAAAAAPVANGHGTATSNGTNESDSRNGSAAPSPSASPAAPTPLQLPSMQSLTPPFPASGSSGTTPLLAAPSAFAFSAPLPPLQLNQTGQPLTQQSSTAIHPITSTQPTTTTTTATASSN